MVLCVTAVYLVAQYARRKMKIVDAVSFHFLFITKLISRESVLVFSHYFWPMLLAYMFRNLGRRRGWKEGLRRRSSNQVSGWANGDETETEKNRRDNKWDCFGSQETCSIKNTRRSNLLNSHQNKNLNRAMYISEVRIKQMWILLGLIEIIRRKKT